MRAITQPPPPVNFDGQATPEQERWMGMAARAIDELQGAIKSQQKVIDALVGLQPRGKRFTTDDF